jgi:Phosphatidylethanolamine-binding protein
MAFTLSSSSFAAGATIPVKHTCDGADRSPPLRWEDAPDAKSFVLIVDDPDAPGGTFTHWVLYDIPGTQRALPEGLAPVSALGTSGTNDFARMGYGGPCPRRRPSLCLHPCGAGHRDPRVSAGRGAARGGGGRARPCRGAGAADRALHAHVTDESHPPHRPLRQLDRPPPADQQLRLRRHWFGSQMAARPNPGDAHRHAQGS